MAAIAWPVAVTQTPKFGFRIPIRDTALRVNAFGAAQVRPSSTSFFEDLTGILRMSDADYGTLRAFYITTCKGGALFFDFVHPLTGATVEARWLAPPVPVGDRPVTSGVSIQLELRV